MKKRIDVATLPASDIDMVAPPGGKPALYTRRDGTPYQDISAADLDLV